MRTAALIVAMTAMAGCSDPRAAIGATCDPAALSLACTTRDQPLPFRLP